MADLLKTVSSLTALGFAGVGVVVFLLLFLLLVRPKPVDAAGYQLYNRFLTMGTIFAMFCGAMTVLSLWLKPDPGKAEVLVNFSPSFATRKLTPPTIQINGQTVLSGQPIPLSGGTETIFIGVDQALADVDAIKETVRNVSQSNVALTAQRDALTNALPSSVAAPQSSGEVKAAGVQATLLQNQVRTAIATGNFVAAANASKQLTSDRILVSPTIDRIKRAAPQ